jgi:O-antigen/teichoic acid export membrane protein
VSRELDLGGRGLREHAAHGTLVNAAFSAGLTALGLVRALVVAALVSAADFGVWGIIVVAFATLSWLRQVGVSDRYVQQAEDDQELAFQRAFTIEALVSAAFLALLLAAIPLMAVAFGRPEVVAPALVLCLIVPAGALQAPIWVHYRRLRYVRQRVLLAVDPVVAFVVTVAAAAGGLGYWAFVAGAVAGAWAAAAAAVASSPYPLRLRLDRASARAYLTFSWPLFVAGLSGVVTAQAAVLTANHTLGLAAVGAMALAATFTDAAHKIDAIVTQALYPAVCAVADRVELLREAFQKSNRLTLMVAAPAGAGMALFAQPFVDHVIGEQWQPAVVLLQALGVAAVVNHIGFNWTAFVRARGDTRPVIGWSLATAAAFFAVPFPLLLTHGLDGYAGGLLVMAAVSLVFRARALKRVLGEHGFGRLAVRGVAPVLPAAAAVLLLPGPAAAELALYLALAAAATALLERDLLREAAALARRPARAAVAGPA